MISFNHFTVKENEHEGLNRSNEKYFKNNFLVTDIIQSRQSELFSTVYVSLARWLAGYEILAFEKPYLHYHKISTDLHRG